MVFPSIPRATREKCPKVNDVLFLVREEKRMGLAESIIGKIRKITIIPVVVDAEERKKEAIQRWKFAGPFITL